MSRPRQSPGEALLSVPHFLQATRDSGYQGLETALAELIDNSIQAGASLVEIEVVNTGLEADSRVVVIDDGGGMSAQEMRMCLAFGGSTRFNDRAGLGRFGMGLPNASLSQARRVSVHSWQRGPVRSVYLDLDEVVEGTAPVSDDFMPKPGTPSGTVVRWTKWDRAGPKTDLDHLGRCLGRRFRYFLWRGLKISINDRPVSPIDPLLLKTLPGLGRAKRYGQNLRIPVSYGPDRRFSNVYIRFAQLPVHRWHSLSNEVKQTIGISNGAGVSIVRGGREIAYGWHFLQGKRRENYDDWWRCEIQFSAELDEAFGVSNNKQQVRPTPTLQKLLSPTVLSIARTLNRSVRQAFEQVRQTSARTAAERQAAKAVERLGPVPVTHRKCDRIVHRIVKPDPARTLPRFRLVSVPLETDEFYAAARSNRGIVFALNSNHPFYSSLYAALQTQKAPRQREMRKLFDVFLLSLGRADALESERNHRKMALHRRRWSETLAAFLLG